MRRVASSNEFFDILDKIGNGKFVTIGYVTGANLDVPKVSRKNPLTNRMKQYPDYTVFGNEQGEIGALVKITSYNMRYLNRTTVGQKYGEYKDSANGIRGNFGLDPIGSKQGYKQGTNWSPNGPEMYNGNNAELQDHSYNPQNIYGVKPRGVVYAVNNEGHIIKELKPEQVKPYLKAKREMDGVAALRKMGTEEERIQDYINQMNNLKFKYINFESNSILWIAATINGEKIVYINDNLSRAVDGININPQDFRAIARERYQIDLTNLQEMVNRMNNKNKTIFRLTESELRGFIGESVKKILSELDWRTYASAAQKNDEWRKEHPEHRANQWNRSYYFRNAARDAFDKKHGLDHQFDEPNSRYGGDKGSINLNTMDDFSVTGSRDHDFGDGDPHGLRHNVYHMGKKYGKDGGYGRTRMWDTAHETTPEKFYGSNEMGKKFRDAEKDAEDFTSGKSHYVSGKGWSNESKNPKQVNERIFSPEEYEDHAFMQDYWNEREQAMEDDWKQKNIEIRKRYPGHTKEWYDAMLDTYQIGESKEDKKKPLTEESFQNNQGYSHFAVSKKSGKIVNGWDYKSYDPSELRQFKKDYFDVDLADYGFNPKDFRILTYKYLVKNGINPDDNANWANNDEANAEFVG